MFCDIDGTIYPYTDAMCAVLIGHNTNFASRRDPTSYTLTHNLGVTVEDANHAHRTLIADPDWHNADIIRPYDGAVTTLTRWQSQGAQLQFVTRRAHFTRLVGGNYDAARASTRRWLDQIGFGGCAVVFTDNKTQHARQLRIGNTAVWLDDNPQECADLRSLGQTVRVHQQPYNIGEPDRFCWTDRAATEHPDLRSRTAAGS